MSEPDKVGAGVPQAFQLAAGKESGPLAPLKGHPGHLRSSRTPLPGEAPTFRAGPGLMAARPLPVCLQDSVLAFWSHGMQGRSLDTNEVSGTQEPNLAALGPALSTSSERTRRSGLSVPLLPR